MNEKQPFEKRIADKLQRLPLPDSESSWQQMKSVLDDKMPRAGGFKPYGRWWWTGMIAVFFTAVIWFVDEQYKSADEIALNEKGRNELQKPGNELAKEEAGSKNNLSASEIAAEKSGEAETANSSQIKSGNTTSLKSINDNTSTLNNPVNQKNEKSTAALANEKNVEKNSASPKQENVISNHSAVTDENNNKTKIRKGTADDKNVSHIESDKMKGTTDGNRNDGSRTLAAHIVISSANKTNSNGIQSPSAQGNVVAASSNKTGSKTYQSQSVNGKNDVIIETSGSAIIHNGQHSYDARTTEIALQENEMIINTNSALTESITNSSSGSVKMSPSVLKKASIVAAIVNDKSKSKKTGQGFSLGKLLKSVSLPYEGENWWAAGLSLNTGVATGSQNRVNYNINAKQGAALDYLPSPYLQYHVNSNLYLQTEFNFSSPQYTEQLLVAQKTREVPNTSDKLLQSTYVQKLYYFNLPLSVYYSPVRNLFFNAGFQFSSLQSGLKQVEERKVSGSTTSPGDPVYTSDVLKFKDDTIAARLSPNEWRWETGANYYVSRFTIGIKYNNSFSDLVKIQPAPGVPISSTRNSTFLVFLRYNLWESRKKESNNNYTSSLFK